MARSWLTSVSALLAEAVPSVLSAAAVGVATMGLTLAATIGTMSARQYFQGLLIIVRSLSSGLSSTLLNERYRGQLRLFAQATSNSGSSASAFDGRALSYQPVGAISCWGDQLWGDQLVETAHARGRVGHHAAQPILNRKCQRSTDFTCG